MGREQHPINCVDWFQATAYCAWKGNGARLPTESEWEYAATSAGKVQFYPWGNQTPSCDYAIFSGFFNGNTSPEVIGCGADGTWPVCSKAKGNSAQSVCDLVGNVEEWNSDWYGPYSANASADPEGAANGTKRALRGNSWSETVGIAKAVYRHYAFPTQFTPATGFRCARTQ